MRVDDRVSFKTVHFRESGIAYASEVVRFGASDGVAIESIKVSIEQIAPGDYFQGVSLSRNPEHEAAPPAQIAHWFSDESLYGRVTWISQMWGTVTTDGEIWAMSGTKELNMHGIVVPSRQIACLMQINSGSCGTVMEIYYREVELSRAEADLMNLTWGKYRR